jgi:hypothetical protein
MRFSAGLENPGLKGLRENSRIWEGLKGAPQIPQLRYAPVGMTIHLGNYT